MLFCVYFLLTISILPRFINDSFACIDGKGTHQAVNKVQKYMRKIRNKYPEYYILKCDIKRFFYSIDKSIIYELMKSYINDKRLLRLTHQMIYDDGEDVGVPIGNYTSQYFANIYLNILDRFIKENLRINYYVRYMDDFILLLKDKNECKIAKERINIFVKEKLHLILNNKSRYYPNKMGIDFCGYRIYETHMLLRRRSKDKIKANIKLWSKLNLSGKLDEKKMMLSYNSWSAHAKHANTYHLRCKMYEEVLNIKKN